MLHGSPLIGGFGLLLLTQHIRTRGAVCAARLPRAAGQMANARDNNRSWTRIADLYLPQHHLLLSPSSVLTPGAVVGTSPHLCLLYTSDAADE